MDTVELLMKMEDHFSIRISTKEAEQITTVGDYDNTIWKHLSEKSSGKVMERAAMERIIDSIIAEFTGLPPEYIKSEQSITHDLGLD